MLMLSAWAYFYIVFAYYTAVLTTWMTVGEPPKSVKVYISLNSLYSGI